MKNSLTLAEVRDWKEAVEADPVARHVNRDDLLALLDLAEAQLQQEQAMAPVKTAIDATREREWAKWDASAERALVGKPRPPVNEGE